MTTTCSPPGPKGKPFVGHLFAFRRDPAGFLLQLAREYGDIVHFRLGRQDVFLLNHPDSVKDVLVTRHDQFSRGRIIQRGKKVLGEGLITSAGEFHHRQRRLAQPAFHRKRIAAYGAVMAEYSARMRERWQESTALDLEHEMMRLTMSIVTKTLFDVDVESEAHELGEALTMMRKGFPLLILPGAELLDRLPIPIVRRFQRALERLDATIYRMIDERRTSGEDRGDLLSMLLLAQDAEGDGGGMTDVKVRDELLTLFLAGHETTASALTWTWYLLSQHPDVEATLHAELDTVLAGRLPTMDDMPNLQYTRMVLAEAMRLYPPVGKMGYRAIQDYEVGQYVVPAGSTVWLSQYAMHHDPRYFPDPFRFDPERWTPEAQAARPKFSYFPFGGGQRQCIGESFAWMAGVLILATIAQRWRLRLVPGHPVELDSLITLRPKHGMRMTLERRCSVPHPQIASPGLWANVLCSDSSLRTLRCPFTA